MADNDMSIVNRNRIYEIPAGTVILNEGETNMDMYKILTGHVEMYTGYGTDNEILIGILGPGACFGEFGILTEQPAIYTIIAFDNIRILRVTEGVMNDFIQENHDSVLQIMKNMANHMMRMQRQINQLSTELAQEKGSSDNVAHIIKENIRSYAVFGNNAPEKEREHIDFTGAKMHYLTGKNG